MSNNTSKAVEFLENFPISDDINPHAHDKAKEKLVAIAKKYAVMEEALENISGGHPTGSTFIDSTGNSIDTIVAIEALSYDPLDE